MMTIDDLQMEVYPVFNTDEMFIHTSNGVLNNQAIKNRKKIFFKESATYAIDDIVKVKQHYPENDISKVELECDFYIVPKNIMQEIMQKFQQDE